MFFGRPAPCRESVWLSAVHCAGAPLRRSVGPGVGLRGDGGLPGGPVAMGSRLAGAGPSSLGI